MVEEICISNQSGKQNEWKKKKKKKKKKKRKEK